jgi:tRNA (guanine37-N1)-methyltransferase
MELPPNSENERSSKSSSKIRFHFLTLFPEIFEPVLSSSLLGKAQKKGLASFSTIQIRDFATDRHRTVDDTPYGGGEGMLLKVDVLHAAWKKAVASCSPESKPLTILLSPQGQKFDQTMAKELAGYQDLILVCGHYEGVDERFIELCVDREVSIGDFVLTGGELPAMVMADAISRWIPGVVGKQQSVERDSLENNLLKYPQYTRPREYEGLAVPQVLLDGDHQEIARWREAQMKERTARKRPDLLKISPKN